MSLYDHAPHPHIEHRKKKGPVKTDHHRFAGKGTLGSLNALIGLKITLAVGTMICAYAFAFLALLALPAVLGWSVLPSRTLLIVAWVSQTFIQLTLLPIIIVGQNIQAKAADARAESTWKDAEAVLAEALKIQEHLAVQDAVLTAQEGKLKTLLDTLSAAVLATQAAEKKPAPRTRTPKAPQP